MVQARTAALKRVIVSVIAGAPGFVLVALYAARLAQIRLDPAKSPGTPAETAITLMVAALAVASFWFSHAVFTGRIARMVGTIGAFAFAGVVAGLCFGVVMMT
jgi:hypothetical protein